MNSYKYIWTAILLLWYLDSGISQTSEWINSETNGSMSQQLTVIGDQIFLCIDSGSSNEIDPSEEYKLSVYEVQLSGEGNLDFTPTEFITLFSSSDSSYSTLSMDYIPQTKEWLIVQTYPLDLGKLRFKFILADEQFNIESSRYFDTLGVVNVHFNVNSFYGHTFGLGTILGPPRDLLLFMDYNHNNKGVLPPIKIGQTSPYQSTWITSIIADSVRNHIITFYYNGIQELDTNLNQIHNYIGQQIHTEIHGQVISIGNNYFSHGCYRTGINGFKLNLLQKYDALFQILSSDTLGERSHDNYPFVTNSMDYRDGNILVGGHLDGPFSHFDIFNSIKKFYLAKYDEQLNRLWYKEYGGDRAYWMAGVKILQDESIMAYGFITDTIDGFRHAYVLHVAKNGDIISSTELDQTENSNIHVLNDGSGNIVVSNPERLEIEVVLYDPRGVIVQRETITEDDAKLDVGFLPPACYFYSVLNNSKIISSGKLVKLN